MTSILLASLPLVLSASPVDPVDPDPIHEAAGSVSIELALQRTPETSVEVSVECAGDEDGESVFQVSDEWGGVTTGGEDLELVVVLGERLLPLESERESTFQWRVKHAPSEKLRAVFRIAANKHQQSSDPDTYRRPIVHARLFHTVGSFAVPLPEHLDMEIERPLELRWRDFGPAGWSMISSFGSGVEPRSFEATLNQLWNSLFVAGSSESFRIHERRIRDRSFYVSIEGNNWGFEDEAFVDLAAGVGELEREFFDDWDKPFYWVSLLGTGPVGAKGSSMGGTGLTNCFSLGLNPDASLEMSMGPGMSVHRLLAHEMFHEWNGLVIEREDPEELVYWFSEGFTNFYARRLIHRAGWIDRERFCELASEPLEFLWTSPARNAPNERIASDFWKNPDVGNLPYHRGDVVAMLVDHGMRRASKGERSLDDLMRALVHEARTDGQRVSTELLLERFERETDAATAAALRAIVVDGETPSLPDDLFAPCLEVAMVEVPTFDIGFDLSTSQDRNEVSGVREASSAHAAGLRDGMRLLGWSVWGGDASREVVLQVQDSDDASPRDVRYMPHGAVREVPRVRVKESAVSADCGL